MSAHILSLAYSGPASDSGDSIELEQKAVSSAQLTDSDLQTMLAMAISGVSARAYKQPGCEAYIVGSTAHADLALYVWPTRLDLAYSLTASLLSVGDAVELRQERDFDLVVELADSVGLPFYSENIQATWQTPCYNARGEVVAFPALITTPTKIELDATVFGVLRIRCTARGYSHSLSFFMAKDGVSSISNLTPTVTAAWGSGDDAQATSLDIDLPACLESLLAACKDGTTYRESVYGSVDEDEDLVPTIYYTPCSGRMLMVRNERP
nr:hypothetical protein [uncultured Desulfobulbus sp.]